LTVCGFVSLFTQNIEIFHPNINIFNSRTYNFVKRGSLCVSLHVMSVYLTTVYDTWCKIWRVYILQQFWSAHTYKWRWVDVAKCLQLLAHLMYLPAIVLFVHFMLWSVPQFRSTFVHQVSLLSGARSLFVVW
jgi:hypothetical protein